LSFSILSYQDANKRKRDGSTSHPPKKNRRSCIGGEEDKGGRTLRQLGKQAAHKPANSSLNEDVEDNNDLDLLFHLFSCICRKKRQ